MGQFKARSEPSGSRFAASRATDQGRWGDRLIQPGARFAIFVVFMVLVALTGGGSRSNILSLLLLRPLTMAFLLYALLIAVRRELANIRAPLATLLAMLGLAALQLIPLPVTVWTALPGRDAVVDISSALGIANQARPLSLDPNRTWNTLFSLFVPLTALLLVGIQAPQHRRAVLLVLAGIGFASAAVAAIQIATGFQFVLYAVWSEGYPVGLFANRNHQAVFLASSLLTLACYAATAQQARNSRLLLVGTVLLCVLLFPFIVLTGSRAGLGLTGLALLVVGWLFYNSGLIETAFPNRGGIRKWALFIGSSLAVISIAALSASLWLTDRNTAFHRIFESNIEDIRWQYFPIYFDIAADYFPFGSGLGSFDRVFRAYEPIELLSPKYLNQAHNDLAQIIIEAGIFGVALVVAGLLWMARATVRLWRAPTRNGRLLATFLAASLVLWLVASLVDYPLRTPLAASVFASLTALLSVLSADAVRRRERAGG